VCNKTFEEGGQWGHSFITYTCRGLNQMHMIMYVYETGEGETSVVRLREV